MKQESGRAGPRETWTAEKKQLFLAHLAATSNVQASAAKARMSLSSVYRLRIRSAEFRARWEVALREGYATLEARVLAQALAGGEPEEGGPKFDSKVALALLAAHRQSVGKAPAAEKGRPAPAKIDAAALRARLIAKFDEMHARMAAEDGDERAGD